MMHSYQVGEILIQGILQKKSSGGLMAAWKKGWFALHKKAPEKVDSKHPPLPIGWIEVADEASGKSYFWDQNTNKTTWERPVADVKPVSDAIFLAFWNADKDVGKMEPIGAYAMAKVSAFTKKSDTGLNLLYEGKPLELLANNAQDRAKWVHALVSLKVPVVDDLAKAGSQLKLDTTGADPSESPTTTQRTQLGKIALSSGKPPAPPTGSTASPQPHADGAPPIPPKAGVKPLGASHHPSSSTGGSMGGQQGSLLTNLPTTQPSQGELDKMFEEFMEEKCFKEDVRIRMRALQAAMKWTIIQQEKSKRQEDKKEYTPAYFAKLLSGEEGKGTESKSGTPGPASAQQARVGVKELQHLRVVLGGQGKSWMQGFVSEGALTALLGVLAREGHDHGVPAEVLRCLKAFMNNEFGLNTILATPAAVDQIALVLTYGNDDMRTQVIELLTVLCWISEQGYQSVMEALRNPRFQRRFQVLVEMLERGENALLKSKTLTFINAVINSRDTLDERIMIRQEFIDLQIMAAVEKVRLWIDGKRGDPKWDDLQLVQTQIDVFTELYRGDRRTATRGQLDLSDVDSVVAYLRTVTQEDGFSALFLTALHHLLAVPPERETAERMWKNIVYILKEATVVTEDGGILTIEQIKGLLAQKEKQDIEEQKSEIDKLQEQIEKQRKRVHEVTMKEAAFKDEINRLKVTVQRKDEALEEEKKSAEEVVTRERAATKMQLDQAKTGAAGQIQQLQAQVADLTAKLRQAQESAQSAAKIHAQALAAAEAKGAQGGGSSIPMAPGDGAPVAPAMDGGSAPVAPPFDAPGMDAPVAPPFDAPGMGGDAPPLAPAFDAPPMAPGFDAPPMAPGFDAPPLDIPGIPGPPGPDFAPPPTPAKKKKPAAVPPKSVKMKAFHWKAVPDKQVEGTLWAEVKEDKVMFDTKDFEERFSANAKVPEKKKSEDDEASGDGGSTSGGTPNKPGAAGGAGAAAKPQKKQLVSLIDGKRSYNINIALARLRMSHAAIRDAILAMDEQLLDEEKLGAVLNCAPTQEEHDMIAGYEGDINELAGPERFFHEVAAIPRIEGRLKLWQFKMKFKPTLVEASASLAQLESGCAALRSSNLKAVMEMVLALGNYLNFNTKGAAWGFQLETLTKLKNTKSNDPKYSLLHFLVEACAKKIPGARNFVDELKELENASRVELPNLGGEIGKINASLRQMDGELKKLADAPVTSDRFVPVMSEFHQEASKQGAELQTRFKKLEEDASKLANYFGEDSASMALPDMFKLFASFSADFRSVEKQINDERENAERQRKRAEEQAKMGKKAGDSKGGDAKSPAKVEAPANGTPDKKMPAGAMRMVGMGGGDNTAIVDKVLGGLQAKDAKDIMKMIQARRAGGAAAAPKAESKVATKKL